MRKNKFEEHFKHVFDAYEKIEGDHHVCQYPEIVTAFRTFKFTKARLYYIFHLELQKYSTSRLSIVVDFKYGHNKVRARFEGDLTQEEFNVSCSWINFIGKDKNICFKPDRTDGYFDHLEWHFYEEILQDDTHQELLEAIMLGVCEEDYWTVSDDKLRFDRRVTYNLTSPIQKEEKLQYGGIKSNQ